MKVERRHIISALLGVGLAALLIWKAPSNSPIEGERSVAYYRNEGKIFGTYYNIRYEAEADLHDSIKAALQAFDNSLSMFNPHSVLSAINANRDTTTDALFEAMWAEATEVYALSGGAFDITVAPLVKAFGFGRKSDQLSAISPQTIDSIRQFVGFDKVQLINHHIVKADPRVQLDGGAVAKGQACDMIAAVLRDHGCRNYLVEIGGEVVLHGVNAQGQPWSIGISKPTLSNDGVETDYQEILHLTDACIATSGNYRNFNEAGGHTIDPRKGYPVQQTVYSATILSSTCMRADALATACMVLGEEEALDMIDRAGDAACLLIVRENDSLRVVTSPKWEEMTTK